MTHTPDHTPARIALTHTVCAGPITNHALPGCAFDPGAVVRPSRTIRATLDRTAGTIEACGVTVRVDASGSVLPALCREMEKSGHALKGMRVEVADEGGVCFTAANAELVLRPVRKMKVVA